MSRAKPVFIYMPRLIGDYCDFVAYVNYINGNAVISYFAIPGTWDETNAFEK